MSADDAQLERRLAQSRLHPLLGAVWALLLLAYIVLVAVATASGHARPAAWILLIMLALGAAQGLFQRNKPATALASGNLVLVAIMFALKGPFAALSLTTAIVQALISWLFLRGLRPGKVDIVTVIATTIRPERTDRERAYIRAVAWCWAVLMALMSAISFTLAFIATGAFWWWWVNVAPYALPLGFFLGEWFFRQFWLREELTAAAPIDWSRLRQINFLRLFQP